MHRGPTAGSTRTIGWRTWLFATLGTAALIVPAVTAGAASAETTWLCKPGLAQDPCEANEETTVELGNNSSSVEQAQPASNPPIDCFYVYPTVSKQSTTNSNLNIEPEETETAIDQASRFSQQCKVYAPMYPQLTLHALEHEVITQEAETKAYLGVLGAFTEYMAKYNDGRGFVLIGHSQGALMLKQLIKEKIDLYPAMRDQLVSAVLLGGNVLVPKGGIVGGDFQSIPACQTAAQTHCVVAYSSFLKEPPSVSDFGRVISSLLGATTIEQQDDDEVLCVNPAISVQGEGAGPLLRYESTTPLPGFPPPSGPTVSTPWVSMPGQYTGECKHVDGASWLQLNYVGRAGDPREMVTEPLGPEWGTHLQDVNVALGNLVGMTALQSATYQAETAPPASPVLTAVPAPAPVLAPAALAPATAPAITAAALTSRRLRVGPKATAVAAERAPIGTAFHLTLSAAASLQIAITQAAPGLRHGRSCVAPTNELKRVHAERCTRTLTLATLTRGEPKGADSVPFSGRIGQRALSAGAYQAVLSASDAAGDSRPVTLGFVVVGG